LAGSKERDRRRARERYEQQRQIQMARRRKIRQRTLIVVAVVCVLGLAGGLTAALVGGSTPTAAKKPAVTASPSASASASASAAASSSAAAVKEPATHCTYTTSGVAAAAKKVSVPPASPDYKATYTAAIKTNLGTIGISLLNSKATCTVNSFVHLASAGYFNSTQCHRLVNASGLYVLQCGDPYATASTKLTCSTGAKAPGTGGPGYEFADENLPTGAGADGTVTYKAATLAMANSGAGTNGSQFFLVYKNSSLGPDYTPFGTITSGLDILQKVANAGTSCTNQGSSAGDGAPKEKVVIDSVTIKQT
jgi:peptidyl-prolyl cis-trans isomerase B (cyclophilin B)